MVRKFESENEAKAAARRLYAQPLGDNYDMEKGGVKFDADKVRMDLVPQDAIMAIAAVFTYGAMKYEDWNWAKGMRDGRIDAAYERHRARYNLGEELDAESGLPHLWHMGCCVLMRIAASLRGVLEDDRLPSVQSFEMVEELFRGMNDPRGVAAPVEGYDLSEARPAEDDDLSQRPLSLYDHVGRGAGVGSVFRVVGWDEWGSKQHQHPSFAAPQKQPESLKDGVRIILTEVPSPEHLARTTKFRKLSTQAEWRGRSIASCLLVEPYYPKH